MTREYNRKLLKRVSTYSHPTLGRHPPTREMTLIRGITRTGSTRCPVPTGPEACAIRMSPKNPEELQRSLATVDGDSRCTAAPRRIPKWVLSLEEVQELYSAGHGKAPELIYAREVPDFPHPDPTSFNTKLCTLIVVEIGFCRDLGCDSKLEAKTKKYTPSSQPSRDTGDESNLSPSLSATPAPRLRRL